MWCTEGWKMTDLRDARLTDVLPKAVADQQEAKSLSDAWHDLTVLILDFALKPSGAW